MSTPPSRDLPDLLDVPAARCDAAGVITAWNAAFSDWAGEVGGARVEIHGARGALLERDGEVRPLVMVPLREGGWLALGGGGEAFGAVAAVAAAVASRLERVELSLDANAQLGLLEQPPEPVARCLRETLATAEEVGRLRRQVAALGARAEDERRPVCLWSLTREAVAALRPAPFRLEAPQGDPTVELDRALFFPVLVALLDDLRAGARADAPLLVEVLGADQVRLRISGASIPAWETPAVAAARRFVGGLGGRVLLDSAVSLSLELPAYARELRGADGYGTVLTVDDDESALAMMGAVLRKAGFHVLAAGDGVAASSLLRQHRDEIVAVVADAVLPGRSGIELAAEARRGARKVPVLLVSGHSSDILGSVDLGGLPILAKPFGARALAERVRAIVDEGA